MRRRFFVERYEGNAASLRGEQAHHLGRVLRAEPGQLYELSDGSAAWLARVKRVSRDVVEFALVEPLPAKEPSLKTALLLSIVKFDRFEWALEKATELGVAEITPLAAARSEKALVAAAAKRAARWKKILLESAQQSRRLRPPELHSTVRPPEAFSSGFFSVASPSSSASSVLNPASLLRILLSESRDAPLLRSAVKGHSRPAGLVLAIGPEGGWTQIERGNALAVGFAEASLGELILRTETAVIAALAALNYALGQ